MQHLSTFFEALKEGVSTQEHLSQLLKTHFYPSIEQLENFLRQELDKGLNVAIRLIQGSIEELEQRPGISTNPNCTHYQKVHLFFRLENF